jgi:hypothetical protein
VADFLTFVKVAVVFVAVVVAMKRKAPMGLALAGGGLAIALLMGKPAGWIGAELAGGLDAILFSAHTGRFVAVMGVIVALSYVLDRAGQIAALTGGFRAAFRDPRWSLAALPAVIGLLPMPGGALFSAPMVEASAAGTGLEREDKALVNYWYRHVWEYAWPLYPGVLFSAQLLSVEVRTLSLLQAPLVGVAILGGILFVRKASRPAPREEGRRARSVARAVVALLPFLLIFALYLVVGLDLVLSVGVAFGVACLWHLAVRNVAPAALLRTVFANWGVVDMMLLGFGAKVFGELMMRSGAIAGISGLFQTMHLPVAALAILLPLAVGFFSGITLVYVMTTFPVLLAYPGVAPVPTLVLAFAAGYCGTLLSPVHSCLVMSTKYFDSDLATPIRRMLVPCAAILLAGVGLFLAYGSMATSRNSKNISFSMRPVCATALKAVMGSGSGTSGSGKSSSPPPRTRTIPPERSGRTRRV